MDLKEFFRQHPKAAIAFSGGVDSSYLLYAALQCGADVRAYYVRGAFQPQFELDDARRLAESVGAKLTVLELDALSSEDVARNPANRCYYCKQNIFGNLKRAAAEDGFTLILDGTNASDDAGDRPGMRALAELGVRSPLREAALTKADIRELSRELGLPTWSKPSFACLATRIPYGEQITEERLSMVDRAEQYLIDRGFAQVRVRLHGGTLGRIEVLPEDFGRAVSLHDEIAAAMGEFGFLYSALDLTGYRTGSMNRAL